MREGHAHTFGGLYAAPMEVERECTIIPLPLPLVSRTPHICSGGCTNQRSQSSNRCKSIIESPLIIGGHILIFFLHHLRMDHEIKKTCEAGALVRSHVAGIVDARRGYANS